MSKENGFLPLKSPAGFMQQLHEYTRDKDYSSCAIEEGKGSGRVRTILSLVSQLRPGTLLDVGCTDGMWGKYWASKGWLVSGVDIDPQYVEKARKNGVFAVVADVNKDKLPFDSGSFDLVFAGEVIEHLIDTDGFLAELGRCLKPGGMLLITTPNLASFENRIRILFGWYPKWMNYCLEGSGHIRAYTPTVLKRQLLRHGFEIVSQTGSWVPFLPQQIIDDVKAPWLSFTGALFPNLAMDIIILARKPETLK